MANAAGADVVSANDRQFGRLLKIDAKIVSIRPGCDEKAAPRDLPWSEVRYVIFDDQCAPHAITPPVAGIANCDGATVTIYQVKYKRGETLDASEVAFDGTMLRARRFTGEWVVDHRINVEHILKVTRCQSAGLAPDSWPDTACVEPEQRAVNWSPSPVADNQIFTKGFAIHVRWDGITEQQAGVSREDVRLAFGSAVQLWASALFIHRNGLDSQLAAYVNSITAKGSRVQAVIGPQVVAVRCPQLAMAIVNVSAGRGRFRDPAVVALAQVEGRTTFLNAGDFKFFSRLAPRADDPPVNLIAVMTHELGHAFGLPDEEGPPEESVMSGVQPDLRRPRDPTAADVRRFAAILRQSIGGAKPGEFNAVRCAGLRVRMSASPAVP
jgi:hypothetical protein